jgi:hypothetical protein
MDTVIENSKQSVDRPGPFLTMFIIGKRAARWLVGLVTLTEEERINAGVYFGHERPQD